MVKEKRTIMKKVILMLCAAMLFITTVLGSSVTDVQAASKVKKAKQAYAKFLKTDEAVRTDIDIDDLTFGLIDVNKDKVPELVVYDDGGYITSVYGYCSGKVKDLIWSMKGGITFYPSRKIICASDIASPGLDGIGSESYYKFDGKKLKLLARDSYEEGNDEYEVKGKKVSKKQYENYIKNLKCKKGISSWDLRMFQNTAGNRKKYLG